MATIYALTDPGTQAVRYVGVTTRDPYQRYAEHWASAQHDTPSCHGKDVHAWLGSLDQPPGILLLEEDLTDEEAPEAEARWVDYYRDKYPGQLVNMADGGGGAAGYRHTEEAKEKISAANRARDIPTAQLHTPEAKRKAAQANARRKGKKRPEITGPNHPFYGKKRPKHSQLMSGSGNPFYGKTHTPETRARISETKTGVPQTPEHKAKIGKALKGRTKTEDHKDKLSKSVKDHWARVRAGKVDRKVVQHTEETKAHLRDQKRLYWAQVRAGVRVRKGYIPSPEDLSKTVEEHLAEYQD